MAINEAKLNEFLGKAVGDLGAAISATLVLIGDRLGLYRTKRRLARLGPVWPGAGGRRVPRRGVRAR